MPLTETPKDLKGAKVEEVLQEYGIPEIGWLPWEPLWDTRQPSII
jgi:hypothetical protein